MISTLTFPKSLDVLLNDLFQIFVVFRSVFPDHVFGLCEAFFPAQFAIVFFQEDRTRPILGYARVVCVVSLPS